MRRSAGEAARAKPAERPGRLHCGDGHTVPKYRNGRSEGAASLPRSKTTRRRERLGLVT